MISARSRARDRCKTIHIPSRRRRSNFHEHVGHRNEPEDQWRGECEGDYYIVKHLASCHLPPHQLPFWSGALTAGCWQRQSIHLDATDALHLRTAPVIISSRRSRSRVKIFRAFTFTRGIFYRFSLCFDNFSGAETLCPAAVFGC